MSTLDERTRLRVAEAITNFCSHQGEPDEGDDLMVWCPDCRKIVHAVIAAVSDGSKQESGS